MAWGTHVRHARSTWFWWIILNTVRCTQKSNGTWWVWNLETSDKHEKQGEHIQGKTIREIHLDMTYRIIMNIPSLSVLPATLWWTGTAGSQGYKSNAIFQLIHLTNLGFSKSFGYMTTEKNRLKKEEKHAQALLPYRAANINGTMNDSCSSMY